MACEQGWIDLHNHQVIAAASEKSPPVASGYSVSISVNDANSKLLRHQKASDCGSRSDDAAQPLTPESMPADESASVARKRRKTVGGLRLSKGSSANAIEDNSESDDDTHSPANPPNPDNWGNDRARQCHINTRFPQRRNPANDSAIPVVQPTSADKLISGIWRQLHSRINLTFPSPVCVDGNMDLGILMADCV